MIADEVALDICRRFLRPEQVVLDPFCGTGRTLLAACQAGGHAIGIDVNPLATILVRAKCAQINPDRILRLEDQLRKRSVNSIGFEKLDFETGRSVSWFSAKAKRDLSLIIHTVNRQRFSQDERCFVAAILSATAREVSYCRKDQWKLHRLTASNRRRQNVSAVGVFSTRLRHSLNEILKLGPIPGSCISLKGDSRCIREVLRKRLLHRRKVDLVFTSPPYGDSKTTVQYGGVSDLCLNVIRHLRRLPVRLSNPSAIDRECLGLILTKDQENISKRIWNGTDILKGKLRVTCFLNDLKRCCEDFAPLVKDKGHVIFVVARRTVGGSSLKLDCFLRTTLRSLGFRLKSTRVRLIKGKLTPYVISSAGRRRTGTATSSQIIETMRQEYILVFQKSLLQ